MKNYAAIKLSLCCFISLMLFLFSSTVFGATVIVDASGGGNFTTIQGAIDTATTLDGDTIVVKDGIYNENVDIDKQLTIVSENGYESTTVIAVNPSDHVFDIQADNVTVEGFMLYGATGYFKAGVFVGNGNGNALIKNNMCGCNESNLNYIGIYFNNSNGNRVINNICNSNGYYGIYVSSSTENKISDNIGNYNQFGISLSGSSSNLISKNIFTGNERDGILLISDSNNNTIQQNTCLENDNGILLYSSFQNNIQNNISNSNTRGIYINSSSDSNIITGNTCYDNENSLYIFSSDNNHVYLNNFISNGTNNVYSSGTNIWYSSTELDYVFNGVSFKGYLGNYYSDHDLSDSNGDGITNTEYPVPNGEDPYPLSETQLSYNFIINVPTDYPTIQAAIDAASDNYLILVADGLYGENIEITKSIILRSENGYSACEIVAANTSDHAVHISAENVTIDGFTIYGASASYMAAIYLDSGAETCTIKNNRLGYDTTHKNDRGILVENSINNTLSNNLCLNNYTGIELAQSSSNNIVSKNICEENYYGISLIESDNNYLSDNINTENSIGIMIYVSNDNLLTKNIVSNNAYSFRSINSENNIIYLNSFINNNFLYVNDYTNIWESPLEIEYEFNASVFNSYLGNHYSDHDNTDSDNNGVADLPYDLPGNEPDDLFPLAAIHDSYIFLNNAADPTMTILSPVHNSIFTEGDLINFNGIAKDSNDNDISDDIVWESDIDGPFTQPVALSAGTHIIKATVIDPSGRMGIEIITITVKPLSNIAPTIDIIFPSDGSIFSEDDEPLAFSALALDPEDGDISANVQWSSSIIGPFLPPASLPFGLHTITATISDSGGLTRSDFINVSITPTGNKIIIDYETLKIEDDGIHNIGSSYEEDGITVYYDSLNGILSYGTLHENFPGSTSIAPGGGFGSMFHVYPSGGGLFDVISIDLTRFDFDNHNSTSITVMGRYSDDSLTSQTFTVDENSTSLTRFYFNETFKDLKYIYWYSGGNTPEQFDNIVVTNVRYRPFVHITAPTYNSTFSEDDGAISFSATATDTEDGDISANIQWSSDIDGIFTSPFALSVGTHNITASVTDSSGLTGTSGTRVTITPHSNVAPNVTITAPSSGEIFSEDDGAISFTGTAIDPEDGNISASIQWSSDLDGVFTPPFALSNGTHTITASVTDSGGLTGSDSITVSITPHVNVAPTITITSPSDGSTFSEDDDAITFTGTAIDPEDGDISASIQWDSDLDGAFTSPFALSVGTHTITASATDSGGLTGTDSITVTITSHVNVAPTVTITSPANGASFSEDDGAISFAGTATDPEDGDISASIQWISDIDGAFTSPFALSVGTHTITASATDSGSLTGSDSITVTITAHVNVAPTITITSPSDGATFSEDDGAIPFTGTATDLEDGDISASIQWCSDIEGAFASPFALSVGTHTITASATDSGGLTGTESITITITPHVNVAPTVAITSPSNGTTFSEDDGAISFTGTANDPEDGDISTGIQWSSNIDGAFISPFALSVGTHTITASTTDSGGLTGTDTITVTINTHVNVAPIVTITTPLNGATYSEDDGAISFSGTATDPEDGDISANIQWSSDIDGTFTSPFALSVGSHTITTSATDSGGLTGSDTITVTITPHVNVAPTVTITSPLDGASFSEDDGVISFSGTANDPEDGDISANIQWSSNLDGGFTSPFALSVGTHTITASSIDSGGLTGTDTITVTITPHVNVAPTVSITSPTDESSFSEDDGAISFTSTATDPEDGDLSASIQWESDLDGGFTSPFVLSVGTHTITASSIDSGGLTGTDTITVTITPHVNVAPTVTITSPSDGASFSEDDGAISFTGTAIDPEDGDISTGIQWNSDVDGAFSSPFALSVGTHTITASATDSGSLTGSDTIIVTITPHVNVAPTVTITSPSNGASFSEDDGAISFSGTATDPEDGDISVSIQWSSNIDGAFTSPFALSVGIHTITASATDSGSLTGTDTITVTITPHVNVAPTVTITAPTNGSSFSENDVAISFTATAIDPEDGDISGNVQWNSNLDGVFTSPATLSIGSHTITATVTDGGGLNSQDTITVDILPVMFVSQIDVLKFSNGADKYGEASIRILDKNGNPVSNATVTGAWSGDASDSDTIITNSDGWATAVSDQIRQGKNFTFCVTDVNKTDWIYDESMNSETCDSN